jgi:hypothetical protein
LSGTVPIFTLPEQYLVIPSWIDWSQLYYLARVDQGRDIFLQDLQRIVQDIAGYNEKRLNILANRDIFDWKNPHALVPFDMVLYQLSIHLYPQQATWSSTTTQSKYGALLL